MRTLHIFLFLLLITCRASFAQTLDTIDLMTVTWEGLWQQGGAPHPVRKWAEPLRVRVRGDYSVADADVIRQSLEQISGATRLPYTLLQADADGESENVLIDVVRESPVLNENTPCSTNTRWKGNTLVQAVVTARQGRVWKCMLHELMHVVGVMGHPGNHTVLTYFGRRNDLLTDYDKFVLAVRYDSALQPGALPVEVLRTTGMQHVQTITDANERKLAQEKIEQFIAQILKEMEAYASGGEPPRVLYRSGRLSAQAVERGRVDMQYMLGMTYLHGDVGAPDVTRAKYWLSIATDAGDARAKKALGGL